MASKKEESALDVANGIADGLGFTPSQLEAVKWNFRELYECGRAETLRSVGTAMLEECARIHAAGSTRNAEPKEPN